MVLFLLANNQVIPDKHKGRAMSGKNERATFYMLGRYPKKEESVTTTSALGETKGMFVANRYRANRRAGAEGKVLNFVAGHGGEVWFVKHADETIAAYAISEMIPSK